MSCIHETRSLISELDSDKLWYIFSMNADMELESEESHPALHTLRKTSQVCRLWREIALGSSSLWGRVVNMATLIHEDDWRDEVIRRTGSSWLCVKATDNTLYRTEHFVKSLLVEHWGRLRSLELHFSRDCTSVDEEMWRSVLCRPAAILETLKLTFHHHQPPYFFAADFSIFANRAPALRTISVVGIAWNLKAPWTSTLRHLALSSSVPVFDILLSLLSIPFPFLETLDLSDSTPHALPSNISRSLHAASFPRLKRIKLYPRQEIEFILSLLAHMTPAAGCAIVFYGANAFVDNAVIDLMPNVLPKLLRYASSDQASLELSLTWDCIDFACSSRIQGPDFQFGLDWSLGLPNHSVPTFLSCFEEFQFDKIRSLSLHLWPKSENTDLIIENFILSMRSVEQLEGIPDLFRYLDLLEKKHGRITFPKLKTIKTYVGGSDISLIHGFLESRFANGFPIRDLTLTYGFIEDMTFLDKFNGLTIRYLNRLGAIDRVRVCGNHADHDPSYSIQS